MDRMNGAQAARDWPSGENRRCAGGFAALRRRPIAVALFSLLMLGGCATLRHDVPKSESHALAPVADTPSSRYIQNVLKEHSDVSGFRLLTKSDNALMSRIALTDKAQHSIDLQYYIFNNDATGRLLAQRLLAAADRGVRVRLLLDDVNSGDAHAMLSALTMHPNIQVRIFNPFRTRDPSLLSKAAQFLLEGRRLNRRMHNKSFIVDGWVAVVGGRNIGDEYFDAASDSSFRDLDLIAIGTVVAAAADSFDKYWNCDAAFPLMALRNARPPSEQLEVERADLTAHAREFAQSEYAQGVLEDLPNGATADRRGQWFWGKAEFVADEPQKIETDKDNPALRIGPKLKAVFDGAQSELILISPYFVPGDRGTKYLSELVSRGVATKVLTNSLASTDEPAVYAGYSHYRRALLEGGVQLHELRAEPGSAQPASAHGTSSGVSLHAKAAVVDRRHVFIGSMNMDPRSKLLNTEMGVIIDCPELADAVVQFFDTAAQAAFDVTLEKQPGHDVRRIVWRDEDGTKSETFDNEPGATAKRRLEVSLIRLLPIEQML
jgi:cardiolipin synthase C